jgi:drug/metabolite transporter (DMT)-like permease
MIPWYLLMPLAAAILYAGASMFIKKALSGGLSPIACFHINNWAGAVVTVPLLFLTHAPVDWAQVYLPMIVGTVFFTGGWFTFLAMMRGDVSLVTPVLGSKLIFVAIASALFVAEKMSGIMWLAALITTAGILLMSATDLKTPKGGRLAGPVVMALISAAIYASSDMLVQRWAPGFGAITFIVIMAITTATLSLIAMLLPGAPVLRWCPATRWSVLGSFLFAVQATVTGLALALFHDAMGVNVVYATRGLWILLIVAVFGPLIGNLERRDSGKAYRFRIIAACMLLVGVICAVKGRMG